MTLTLSSLLFQIFSFDQIENKKVATSESDLSGGKVLTHNNSKRLLLSVYVEEVEFSVHKGDDAFDIRNGCERSVNVFTLSYRRPKATS